MSGVFPLLDECLHRACLRSVLLTLLEEHWSRPVFAAGAPLRTADFVVMILRKALERVFEMHKVELRNLK